MEPKTRKPRTETPEQRSQRLAFWNRNKFNAPDTRGGTLPLNVRVRPEQKAWVQAQVAATGQTEGQIVRAALDLLMGNNHDEQSQTIAPQGTGEAVASNGKGQRGRKKKSASVGDDS